MTRKGWQVTMKSTPCARAEENHRRMVVGTGRLYPTQTSETSFQETTHRRGRSTSAVTGRSRRLVEFEKRQRWHDLSPHGDRSLCQSGLVYTSEEQVRGVVGDDAKKHVHQRRCRQIKDSNFLSKIPSGFVEEVRHPSFLHSQRGDEGEHRRKI